MLNLVFLGDSLTESIPRFHRDVDTYPLWCVSKPPAQPAPKFRIEARLQAIVERSSIAGSLRFKPGAQNVLVLWAGWTDERYFGEFDPDFLHPRFITTASSLGGLGSANPNFQNMPHYGWGAEIRAASSHETRPS